MTGFDGLVDARERQISDVVRRSRSRLVPGTGKQEIETTLGEKALGAIGVVEELASKVVGQVTTDDPKYSFRRGIGNYHTQTGFADNFRDAGFDPTTAAILGIAAAIVNPIDPVNKLKIFQATKLGKAAEVVETAGKNLVKDADGIFRLSTKGLAEEIAAKTKALEQGQYTPEVARLTRDSIKRLSKAQDNQAELNGLLEELQLRGVKVNELRLAGSTFDQIRLGQRHLVGFSSPAQFDQLSLFGAGRNPLADTSVVGFGGPKAAAIVKAATSIKQKIGKPLSDAAYKVADYIGIPTIRTDAAKQAASMIKKIMDGSKGNVETVERDLLSLYQQMLRDYGPEGADALKSDLLQVMQQIEFPNPAAKEVAINTLSKLEDTPVLQTGKGAVVESGGGLSPEQKIRLTQSGVEDSEIPVAISQFKKANSPSQRLGTHKEHELKLLGRYVVVKTSDAKAALDELKDLDGIYGNRVWAKHNAADGTYLIQKRHPGAKRITTTDDFEPVHLRQLENIAAQLSNKKKGFSVIQPEDILVSPSGAVQIINPSVIVEYKSQKDAIVNSKQVLDSLAESLAIPRGSLREFVSLKNTKTARAVPRGVDGLAFRKAEGGTTFASAEQLMEQAVNTEGFKQYVRASYDQVSPEELAKQIGDPSEFERANNIEFERQRIREQIAQGLSPSIEPISFVKDDYGNVHVRSIGGRARLTAAILEGVEAVPIFQHPFVGDVASLADKGFYSGKTAKLTSLWNPAVDSSANNIVESSAGIVAGNYSLIPQSGEIIKLTAEGITVKPELATTLSRLITTGPQFVGKARSARVDAMNQLLAQKFGNLRNAYVRVAEIAEVSPDLDTFVKNIESLLVNPKTKQGIKLDNVLRHPDSQALLMKIKELSTESLDTMASNGVLTSLTVNDPRRVLLASDASDLVVHVMDPKTNTLKVYGNHMTTSNLQASVESFINKTTSIDDVEPYARIELNGIDGIKRLEVKDLVTGVHPKLQDVLEPVKVFSISDEQAKLLRKEGIFVVDVTNAPEINTLFRERYFPQSKDGKSIGVLLNEQPRAAKSSKTGQFVAGTKEAAIVRPEFSFFVTRSGAVVIGTRQNNVSDLLTSVFEEGPAFFEEFGVMTTGKIIISNPYGAKMTKIGVGEIRFLEDRLKSLATKFRSLGFSDGTVLDVRVPWDDAVWRSMYGERVTVGNVLNKDFKINVPDQLKGFVPDIRVLAPGRVGAEGQEMGVVGLEKTRLANDKLQRMLDAIRDHGDRAFLDQAKAGLPISYYSSWIARYLTNEAKGALDKMWLKNVDTESKTFKHIESAFKGRVITDLTTQEVNSVIRRLHKEGVENAEDIISDVVKKFRDGYVLKPTKESAATLVALSKALPEGIDFFYLDPIYATALAVRGAQRAIGRAQIVESLKELGVAVWHGSIKELNALKVGKSKDFLKLESDIERLGIDLVETKSRMQRMLETTPDIQAQKLKAEFEQSIDSITNNLADAIAKKTEFVGAKSKGKVLDTMVDLGSEHVWIKGEELTRLIDEGIISQADILGDPSDIFVRVPVKKYASLLDENNAEAFLFPKEVAGVVQKYFSTTTKDGFGKFLSLWDSFHSLWRNWTLFPIPAYHGRNIVSNMFMAYLGDVTDPRVYDQSLTVMNIIDGHRKGSLTTKQVQEALGAISFPTASGQVATGQQMFDEFVRHGGLAGGLHFNEFNAFGNLVRASEFERLSIKAGLRPASELAGSWLFDNSALRLGVGVASYVENRFRLATFIDAFTKGRVEVKGGMTISGFDAAAMHMKRVFYDYSDLSAFERGWLRRVLPFYSWSRHNIPRMLETLVTDPIKHYRVASFIHDLETGVTDGNPPSENDIPEWIRSRYGFIVGKTENGNYLMQVGDGTLPMIDAYKMIAGGDIVKMVKDGLTPFVKTPIEQLTNYSLYSQREIERVPGERSSSELFGGLGFSKRVTTEGPLGVLNLVLNESLFKTFFRPSGEPDKIINVVNAIFDGNEDTSVKLGIFALFLGKAYEIDPVQARMAVFTNWRSRHSQLIGLRNQAAREGDLKSVDDADRMLTWLRLQYPGNKE